MITSPVVQMSAPGLTPRQVIVHGDCLCVMAAIPPESVNLVITSPPYDLKKDYGTYRDDLPYSEYLEWMEEVARAIRRILAPSGSLFLNVGWTPTNPWLDLDVAARFRDHLVLQNRIVWVKSVTVEDRSRGHYTPITSSRFLNSNTESLLHFSRHGNVALNRLAIGVPYVDERNVDRFSRPSNLRCRGNAWFISHGTVCSKAAKHNHPATYPPELPEMCIKLHGIEKSPLVLDPFVGSGSTLVACQRLGLHGIGVELNPEYCRTAERRLSEDVFGLPVEVVEAGGEVRP